MSIVVSGCQFKNVRPFKVIEESMSIAKVELFENVFTRSTMRILFYGYRYGLLSRVLIKKCVFENRKEDPSLLIAGRTPLRIIVSISDIVCKTSSSRKGSLFVLCAKTIILRRSLFQSNKGGGLRIENSGVGTLEDCRFVRNVNEYGGAVHISDANVHIIRCSFIENKADTKGGAVYVLTNPGEKMLRITKCSFRGSSAELGGTIAIDDGNLMLVKSLLRENKARSAVGGIYMFSRLGVKLSATILNSVFLNNSVAVVSISVSKVLLENVTLLATTDSFHEHIDIEGDELFFKMIHTNIKYPKPVQSNIKQVIMKFTSNKGKIQIIGMKSTCSR